MCGIVAYIGSSENAAATTTPATTFLMEGLLILQNRGYDSAGICTVQRGSGALVCSKQASQHTTSDSIDRLQQLVEESGCHGNDVVGIAHMRWATHGGKTTVNAHPHLDAAERVAIVHNGTIENFAELREELIKAGVQMRGETDSEVVAQMIGQELALGKSPIESTHATLGRLCGTWGLALVFADEPSQIIVASHGSPLCIGIGSGGMFVASEPCAFSRHTNQYIRLRDDEVAIVRADSHSLDVSRVEEAPNQEAIALSPAPHSHWTVKEILEQPESIARCLAGRFTSDGGHAKIGGLWEERARLTGIRHLVISACGTSLYAGMYGARLMRKLGCFDTVQTVDAAEMVAENFSPSHSGLLVLSQSGETKDTHRAVALAQTHDVPTFSIVNQVASLIARTTGCGMYLHAGRECAVASTKAFSSQVVALSMMACWFAHKRAATSEHTATIEAALLEALARQSMCTSTALRSCRDACKAIASSIYLCENLFVLGKGLAEPIAMEGALKIKEITYIHAQGYSGGALKHGPFALLEEGTPVIMVILDDEHADLMRVAAAEVGARDANLICITDNPRLVHDVVPAHRTIVVPSNGPLTALLAAVPLQLLAYEISILKGINPDKPKNLAKAVTTD